MYILDTYEAGAQTNDIYPQVESMGAGYQWDDPDSVTRMRSGLPLSVAPNLRAFHLDPETNLTDVVTQGYTHAAGLLVSDAFVGALEGCVVQAHERYPAEVVHQGEARPYCWLHMVEELEARIDCRLSRFTIRRHDGRTEHAMFKNTSDLRHTSRELVNTSSGTLLAEHLTFSPGTPRYDLFSLLLTGRVFFVSDALAAELRRRELTGFKLIPTAAEFTFS